jgi:alpha-methylacyl-CoA racemase
MMLADFGADVIEIRRPVPNEIDAADQFVRGKRQLTIDLRASGGAELIARLTDTSDVFLEGYGPGTMERRGLGPTVLMERNPRLVYTRLTGWGQEGPYAAQAGHDINYMAIGGPLGAVGSDSPVPAVNLLGDFASGLFPAVLGTVLALLARERTGRGQVVDAGMVDGAAYLLFAQFCEAGRGEWQGRGTGMLSGVAGPSRVMPALFTSTSRRPNSSMTRPTVAQPGFSSVMSAGSVRIAWPVPANRRQARSVGRHAAQP